MQEARYDAARAKALMYGDRLYYWDNGMGASRPRASSVLAQWRRWPSS